MSTDKQGESEAAKVNHMISAIVRSSQLLADIEAVMAATHLGIGDLLRTGLHRVIAEFKTTGGVWAVNPEAQAQA